ncbi:MAG TPA: hypothetical protein VH186_25065 [Chloroflexia bacterium]|nr:hypothetical protein [Chloroflexia bacterium]
MEKVGTNNAPDANRDGLNPQQTLHAFENNQLEPQFSQDFYSTYSSGYPESDNTGLKIQLARPVIMLLSVLVTISFFTAAFGLWVAALALTSAAPLVLLVRNGFISNPGFIQDTWLSSQNDAIAYAFSGGVTLAGLLLVMIALFVTPPGFKLYKRIIRKLHGQDDW